MIKVVIDIWAEYAKIMCDDCYFSDSIDENSLTMDFKDDNVEDAFAFASAQVGKKHVGMCDHLADEVKI